MRVWVGVRVSVGDRVGAKVGVNYWGYCWE